MRLLKRIGSTLAVATLLGSLTACGTTSTEESSTQDSSETFTVTDVIGHTVEFNKAPERIVLGEGRALFATSILNHEEPFKNVVAMGSDLKTSAPSFYQKLEETHPELNDVPTIGAIAKGDVTVENLISYSPDIVIITKDHYDAAQGTGMIDKMDTAGIKYLVTDFRQHPLENTTASVDIFGKVFDREEQAQKFNEHWKQVVEGVKEKVASADSKPRTFLWRAAGQTDCCMSFNKSNFAEFINVAGGENIGDNLLDGEEGSLTPEKVIEQQPEVIIATGGSWAPKKDKPQPVPHVSLGYATDYSHAESTLAGLLKTPGFDQLKAPQNGEFYGIWHQYYDSPLNYLAIQQIAQWLHPELFTDLDMDQEIKQAHQDFQPFEASGTFFVQHKVDQK
ncbi:ABC transporter substrate-binding protein [Rothia amarae]|uniref:ABC transporter substrate-binding protein n=1 Tax=Rothia amarae TaxID=169480 RepID=A0A7H2BKF4_9MICC|nr:ABC transporter substrate-binding protein [Rothia amarae]QNV40150.1 ABC transporter substrate-binding protein [Rothia amarae]